MNDHRSIFGWPPGALTFWGAGVVYVFAGEDTIWQRLAPYAVAVVLGVIERVVWKRRNPSL